VLRAARRRDGATAASRCPVPGVARRDSLLDMARRAGLHVDLARHGEPRALPPAVDVTAYRIVQESLTNVVQHADAARVDVAITYRPAEVGLSGVDDGQGAGSGGKPPEEGG